MGPNHSSFHYQIVVHPDDDIADIFEKKEAAIFYLLAEVLKSMFDTLYTAM